MARYDRIARIEPPPRTQAFAGWPLMRDLEGHEREAEFARRTRVRFLVLRVVLRLLGRGIDGVDRASLERQVEGVREELGHLPSRDTERRLLAGCLREAEARDAQGLTLATLALGDAAESAGHGHAAEEFYLTSLALAGDNGLTALRTRALLSLAGLSAKREAWAEAGERFGAAAAAAEEEGDAATWGEASCGLAMVQWRSGDVAGGRRALAAVAARGERDRDDRLIAVAAATGCSLELDEDRTEAALEAGWRAVELLAPSDPLRGDALLSLAAGFRRLRLRGPAEACYRMILDSSAWSVRGAQALLELAVTAAEARDAATFDRHRHTLLETMPDGDARLAADVHLALGRGAMLLEDADRARIHLRQAMTTARRGGLGGAALVAEDLLSGLERLAERALDAEARAPSAGVRTIAQRVESLGRAVAGSG